MLPEPPAEQPPQSDQSLLPEPPPTDSPLADSSFFVPSSSSSRCLLQESKREPLVDTGPPAEPLLDSISSLSWPGNRYVADPQYLDDSIEGIAAATIIEEGKVKRHAWRGEPPSDAKEQKRWEDEASWCGNRNPAALEEKWAELFREMRLIAQLLLQARKADPELQSLTDCFGEAPTRQPPIRSEGCSLEGVARRPA